MALWQAKWVARRLAEHGAEIELVTISTTGDREAQGPIDAIGTQGVFAKEIQNALRADRIDLAVHSLKDLSTEPVTGLCLAAVPERGPAGDVLVFGDQTYRSLDGLPPGAVVGTGSLRRRTQLLHVRPDLQVEPIRGNVETRLRKLDTGRYDAVVLAEAGLRRLGFDRRIGEILSLSVMLPAVGQGALGVEARQDNQRTRAAVDLIDHWPTHAAVIAERAMLRALKGGCSAPVAGWGCVEGDTLRLAGRVLSVDGTGRIDAVLDGPLDEPERLGQAVARRLTDQGAAELIRQARQR